MKKYVLILAALVTTLTFAQIFPDDGFGGDIMSGEPAVFNSAPIMSGEPYQPEYPVDDSININLPYDPSEEEGNTNQFNSANDYQFPPYSLNSAYSLNNATKVKTGPETIIFFMVAVLLGASIFAYRARTKREE